MESEQILQLLVEVSQQVVEPKFRALVVGEVEEKSPGDFVTVVDRAAELAISERLKAMAPSALLVGEEATYISDDNLKKLAEVDWAFTIDPIDGTSNFVQGKKEYALMISEVRSGITTRAWIWQPEYQTSYVAELGAGCYRNGERLTPIERDRLAIGVTSDRHYHGFTGGGLLAPVAPSAWSAGFDYPNVLMGVSDYVYYRKLKPWDHLPGSLMLKEVEGVSRTRDGREYCANTRGHFLIAAATESIWQLANQLWPDPPAN